MTGLRQDGVRSCVCGHNLRRHKAKSPGYGDYIGGCWTCHPKCLRYRESER